MAQAFARTFKSCLFATRPGWDARTLSAALHSGGFAVLERPAGDTALAMAVTAEFDVVFWGCDGSSADLPALGRLALNTVPVVAVLAEPAAEAVATCLESGADACVHLQAESRVVLAQVSALGRRREASAPRKQDISLIQIGDLVVDSQRCEVERGGSVVPLTASEYRIMEYMVRNAGRVLRPQEILNAVTDEYAYSNREAQEVFKVYARRIRRKLEPDEANPRYLVNVRGFGYRLDDGSDLNAIAH